MQDRTDLAIADEDPDEAPVAALSRRRGVRRALLGSGVVLAVVLGGVWLARVRIADTLIADQLASMHLPATYRVESIGPGVEVLRDIVIGDPAYPDVTIERAELRVAYGLGVPRIGAIKLVRPRVYASFRNNRLSFGALDRVLYAPSASKEPFRLPDYDLTLVDARGLVDSVYGRAAFKADGSGNLRDGFAGALALVAPSARLGDCAVGRVTAYGKVAVRGEQPRFEGPLRLDGLNCGASGASLAQAAMQLDAMADRDLSGLVVKGKLRGGAAALAGAKAESVTLDTGLTLRKGALSGRIAGNLGGLHTAGGSIGLLGLDGMVRAGAGMSTLEFRGTIDGQGLRQGPALDRALASAEAGAQGTLAAPMVAQVRGALRREERGSSLGGDISYRQDAGGAWTFVAPNAVLRGGSGQALLSLSRFQLAGAGGRTPRMAGSFATGGAGLPRIAGRLEQSDAGRALFRLTMAPYRAGDGAIEVPQMLVAQVPDGSLGFSGVARISGMIPAGSVRNLVLPVQGAWSSRGELALWPHCIVPRFDSLVLGEMALDGQAITLCPAGGQAIVRSGTGGLKVAAGLSSLALSGRLGQTPLRLQSGAVGLAWPGTMTARAVDVTLGQADAPTRFRLNDLVAHLGKDLSGTFGGVEARLAAVPVDVTEAAGQWRYAGQALTLSGISFALADRQNPARFEKLAASDATLTLAGGKITAEARLHEPRSGAQVVRAVIRHDLADASGHADLLVDGLRFEDSKDGLQPADITRLTLGVVANVSGTVSGTGRVDWDARGVTSSGRFGTTGLDLAAAFGPAKGLSGTLEFTDLLGMVTAPHQTLKVASINPGIEVTDGTVDLQLLPGQVVRLNGATWPFLGGSLALEPTDMRMAVAEPRRYTLTIVGLDAAKFLTRMDLGNLAATGTFDGQLPLVFDANGGRIEGGNLVSRPPGGSVSYVGALSYKDLSSMANYAFDALKALDYKTMTIAMKGDLAGEIVTNVRFGGVKQGAGTTRNFVTRQLANLPIQFNVNVRAPFYQLITSVKSMYDPTSVKDPRTLGLIDGKGRKLQRFTGGGQGAIALPQPASAVQSPASGTMP